MVTFNIQHSMIEINFLDQKAPNKVAPSLNNKIGVSMAGILCEQRVVEHTNELKVKIFVRI